ncbi:universal stress protein [Streptomyces sp. NRRL WC-3742]|uniref:universal stress protein n=1 Tax=Streptomyces sp. NRRL WC-3742 TaxID=1463934 RepID=UPI0004C50E29|nr:universal stress protein [Streptomyces sp. NRRL WC-3742]
MSANPRIVVGVDGSPASEQALKWALDYARAVGGTIHAVAAWEYPAFYGWGGQGVPTAETFNPEEIAGQTLAQAIEKVAGTEPGVTITRDVVPGGAPQALLSAAKGAALLVVGSRGLGGFSGVLLGSVSRHVTEHAPCPVTVVREGAVAA